jgi:prenyltransferase beta subunit
MRPLLALLLLPAFAFAQTADEKKATVKFIDSLRDPETGAWAVNPPKDGEKLKPSLRAVNGAVNALKFFGGELTDKEKVTKFVLSCYDEKTGAFAEPGDKPSVTMTSVGVLAATALGIDKAKYKKAMDYLKGNAKTFEDYRIGAAAIEAYGVKESGLDMKEFFIDVAEAALMSNTRESYSLRGLASSAALEMRLGRMPDAEGKRVLLAALWKGQMTEGGWGKPDSKASDAETTYRVMRALMLLKEKPKDPEAVKKFVASCRRPDGGYGVDATSPSSMSGVYYAAKISEWLK